MDIPQPSHPFLHRTPAQTRFNDYDLLGHLNNNIYLVLADMGKAGYFPPPLGLAQRGHGRRKHKMRLLRPLLPR